MEPFGVVEVNETLAEARERNVREALAEDIGTGDWTARLVPSGPARARIRVREEAVLCGIDWFEACVRALDPAVTFDWSFAEGDEMTAGSTVCELAGHARALLSGERPALNFLQLLSGTATVTRRYARAIRGASPNARGCLVLDTRKTVPGLRLAQKHAVRVGGGANQRIALWDGILIKENHIAEAGGIAEALAAARALGAGPGVSIQIEVEGLDQLREALRERRDEHPPRQLHAGPHARGSRHHRRAGAPRGVGRDLARGDGGDRRRGVDRIWWVADEERARGDTRCGS